MNTVTKHRGPDGTDIFCAPDVTLGHNRLAIIDLDSRARQPMATSDGRYVIVFNGEIYNYRELKEALSDYAYKTESDTEVILAGYAAWGADIFSKLNGMFALAIWDTQTKTLVLARDPVGIKPLYYHYAEGKLVFSSELTGVLKYIREPHINVDALNMFFDLMYVPGPHTLVAGLLKLQPSTYMTLTNGVMTQVVYQTNVIEKKGATLLKTISDSVKRQLVSDRPVGVFLSGGLDSSIVLHHVMEHEGKADTFTIGYDLPESEKTNVENFDEKFNRDMYLAKKTAEHYGTRHHEYTIRLQDIEENLVHILESIDEPIGNPTIIPTYLLSKFAREQVVVALDGSGGDELFGGYEWYKITTMRTWLPTFVWKLLTPLGRKLKKMSTPLNERWYHAFMAGASKVRPLVLTSAYCRPYVGDKDATKQAGDPTIQHIKHTFFNGEQINSVQHLMDIDRSMWLVDESLMRSDKMSMAHGLEMRVPLLDLTTVSYANQMDVRKKVSWRDSKIALKAAYKEILPRHLFNQPKRGWFTPGAKWLREERIIKKMREILSKEYNPRTERVFNWEYVSNELIAGHLNRGGYHSKTLWGLMMFQVWAKKNNIIF